MADRLKSLRRIEAVQQDMIRLAEWRLAAAETACRAFAADAARLRDYVSGEGSLGVTLGRSALKSLDVLDRRLAVAEQERVAQRAKLDALRRRDHVLGAVKRRAAAAARREDEARDLAMIMEAWLAANPV